MKQKPIPSQRGWLYWDLTVVVTRTSKDSGPYTARVTGNRTGRTAVVHDKYPMAAFFKAMVKVASARKTKTVAKG